MAIVSCPECGKKLKIADTSVGKKVKGPCGHVFVADGDSPPPAASKPAATKPAPAVTPEKVYVACTECESKLKVATTSLGKKMKCPKCSAVFVANLPEEKKAPEPEEEEVPTPKGKGKPTKPAVTDDDMDDLLNFAAADAETKNDSEDEDDLFKNEPVKSRAKRRMDEDEDEDAPKPKGKPAPDEDDDELPTPKKKPSRADDDEEPAKPVYPSRLIPNLIVALLLLIFIGLVAAIFFDVNIAKELGLPESKGLQPKQPAKIDNNKTPTDPEAARKADLAKLEGAWVVEKAEQDGTPIDNLKGDRYVFTNGKVTGPDLNNADFTIDASKTPKTIDLHTLKTEWFLGIYEIDGPLLKLCTNTSGEIKGGKLGPDNLARRPKTFDSKQGTSYFLKRDKGGNGNVGKDPKKDVEDIKKDVGDKEKGDDNKGAKLEGIWVIKAFVARGKAYPEPVGEAIVIADGKFIPQGETQQLTIDATTDPKSIDIGPTEGIFRFVGRDLQIAVGPDRPKDFAGAMGNVTTLRPLGKGEVPYSKYQSTNKLKNIALAMHVYHSTHKHFPQIAIGNEPGKQNLSWRVAILPHLDLVLPHLDLMDLYKEFDLSQPWDHPTNKKLIAKMPNIYAMPGKAKEGLTHFRAFDGNGTPLQSGQKTSLVMLADGSSNTIVVVEAAEPTTWTKPDDLKFDPKGPLPKFGVIPDGFQVAMADGTTRYIKLPVKDEVIRPYLSGSNNIPRQPVGEGPAFPPKGDDRDFKKPPAPKKDKEFKKAAKTE